jgi:hypothetical protein
MIVGLLSKLRSLFHKPPAKRNTTSALERLAWLESHENPFGVRVLDCRPVAETFLSATEDPALVRFFGSPESRSGEQFRGQHPPEAIRVPCSLAYPLAQALPEGPLFLAGVMEEKWNIYCFGGALYFVRSWTGQLLYVAQLAEVPGELHVVEVEAWPGNVVGSEQMAVHQVDYLIKSHLFNQVAPHPVPPLPSAKDMAIWSFSQYGRRGLFAVVEQGLTPTAPPAGER